LRDADKEIESLSFYSVLSRVARVLLGLEKKYGKSTPHGRCLDLPLDKKDIAELVGTVREVATRALKQLTKFGCIKYIGRRVIIVDKDKLKYITGLKDV
jgi:CRP/FNR family transcriptional regulator